MGIFRAAHGCGVEGGGGKAPLRKIIHTYPAMMKLGIVIPYLKISKIFESRDTHTPISAEISIFHRKPANFVISRNTDIDCILIHSF